MQRAPHPRNTCLSFTIHGDSNDKSNSKALTHSPVVRMKKTVAEGGKEAEQLDELDLILCHEDFAALVSLSKKVKNLHHLLQRGGFDALKYYEQNMPVTPKSSLTSKEVMDFVEHLREGLSIPNVIIRRGAYPVTDASLDDNFAILHRELEHCESSIRKTSTMANSPGEYTTTHSNSNSSSTKYAKWQSDILFRWLVENHKAPKLRREACLELARRTGLTTQQVSTWLQNMRRRRQTNTVKGNKKAAHFLDFLFLARERDQAIEDAQTGFGKAPKRPRVCDIFPTPDDYTNNNDSPAQSFLALMESFDDDSHTDIEPIDIFEYEFNGSKEEENELLQVFAQAWHHEALAQATALPPPLPPPPPPLSESRDDDSDIDILLDEDISPFGSEIFRKRSTSVECPMEDSEFSVAIF